MDIISRAEAKRAGLNRYFTGIPCKNGHVDFRYTASGACKGCIAISNGRPSGFNLADDPEVLAAKIALDAATVAYSNAVRVAESRRQLQEQQEREARLQATQMQREEMGTVAANVKARQEAKAQLVQAKFRIFDVDREVFAATVWAMASMRYPVLTQGDVDPHLVPQGKAAGTALHAFLCHPEDVETLRTSAYGLIQSHKLDTTHAEEQRRKLEAAANVDTAPEWRP